MKIKQKALKKNTTRKF